MSLNIIYEDKELIVCEKPAGVSSQGDRSMAVDMISKLKTYLYEKEGMANPYIAGVHRLDRPVGGVMVFAKNKNAAADLSRQIRDHETNKRYYAIVQGMLPLTEEAVRVEDYLLQDPKTNTSKVVKQGTKDAKEAVLLYTPVRHVVIEGETCTVLDVQLLTGRHHQIRVQLGEHFGGIWGDTKYNDNFKKKRGFFKIALYSYFLSFTHPKTKKAVSFEQEPTAFPFSC